MLSTLTLTACSSTTAGKPAPSIAVKQYHPELPDTLVLEDEKFIVCPNEDPAKLVCMDHTNAQKVSRNKVKTLKWAKDARAVMDYYTRSGAVVSK
jgi:hypothetical protein